MFTWFPLLFSGVTQVLKVPGVLVATSSIIATSMSIGFLQATLEPHLRQFKLSPVILGLMFVLNGGTYAITAPAWGWFCDKHSQPKVIIQTSLKFVVKEDTRHTIIYQNIMEICIFNCNFQVATVAGCILVCVGFCLVGPAPFIPSPTIIWLTLTGLVIHGFGMAAQLVASFTDAMRTSM